MKNTFIFLSFFVKGEKDSKEETFKMKKQYEYAKQIYSIYTKECAFPLWVLDKKKWKTFAFQDTLVFYHKYDTFSSVKTLMKKREPCNLGMNSYYDKKELKEIFGWTKGAYHLSTIDTLMPNIAVYCYATVLFPQSKTYHQIHVLNVIGYAFDTPLQPDYQYFQNKPFSHLLEKYSDVWKKVYYAMMYLHKIKGITCLQLYNIGGGVFAGPYQNQFIETIFEPCWLPWQQKLQKHGIQIKGYNEIKKQFTGKWIPDCLEEETEETLQQTLYLNAWDPWSLIGNGNEMDFSLDGSWGKCSNMSVLGWSMTNPSLTYVCL